MQKKKIFAFLSVLFICVVTFIINSCRKEDTKNPTNHLLELAGANSIVEKFLTLSSTAHPSISKIVAKIRRDDQQYKFLNNFIRHEGFAIWDKAMIKSIPSNTRDGSADSSDEQVLVPLVRTDSTFVQAALACRVIDDSVFIQLLDGRSYPSYNADSINRGINGRELSLTLMMLDKEVFGHDLFEITDSAAFGGTGRNVLLVRLTGYDSAANNLSAGLSSYPVRVCYTKTTSANEGQVVNGCPTGSNCPQTTEIQICEEFSGLYEDGANPGGGSGSGSPGGGSTGSGGGGSTGPVYGTPPTPCTPAGPISKAPVTCSATTPGWIPSSIPPMSNNDPCTFAKVGSDKATALSKNAKYTSAKTAVVNAYNADKKEHGVAFGKDAGGNVITSTVTTGNSNSSPLGTVANRFADLHNHPNNSPPSSGDLYGFIDLAASSSTYETRYIVTQDGTVYALIITDLKAAKDFNTKYPRVPNPGNSPDFPEALVEEVNQIKGWGGATDEMAMAFMLSKYNSGIALLKQDISGNFKRLNTLEITNTTNGSKTYQANNCK